MEETSEKLDLCTSNLSTTVRLALENDPTLIKTHGGDALLGDDGQMRFRKLKFNFDAESSFQKVLDQPKEIKEFSLPTLDSLALNEDAQVPMSNISCSGCGAQLHCKSKRLEGFMLANTFKTMSKRELRFAICYRCETLNKQKIMLNLEGKPFDYDNFILKKILAQRKAHVILLIDLLDIPNSIYDNWSKLINNKGSCQIDLCIIGNKFDLLPNTGPIFYKSIMECLIANCAKKGILGEQIKYVELISAKSGFNIENVCFF